MKAFVLLVLCFSLIGCTSVSTVSRPGQNYESHYSAASDKKTSLFPSDSETLSDADIARVLDAKLKLPAQIRIGLLNLGHHSSYSYYYSSSPQSAISFQLSDALKKSPRIFDASYLPSFLIPPKKTIGRLREAAARYQADLLFIYTTDCQQYDRFNFFESDESKVYCTAESALLDTRTGIVPFTSTSLESYSTEKDKSDLNFRETIRRAEQKAIEAALIENANNLVQFLATQ